MEVGSYVTNFCFESTNGPYERRKMQGHGHVHTIPLLSVKARK